VNTAWRNGQYTGIENAAAFAQKEPDAAVPYNHDVLNAVTIEISDCEVFDIRIVDAVRNGRLKGTIAVPEAYADCPRLKVPLPGPKSVVTPSSTAIPSMYWKPISEAAPGALSPFTSAARTSCAPGKP